MKKIIFIILLSKFAFTQTATLDTNKIIIGQQIKFTITNKVNATKIWPKYNEYLVDGIEISQASKIDTTDNTIMQQFIITAWDSGSYYIPPIVFSQNSRTKELLINVETIILKEDAELKDIKEPINEPIGWVDIWPWLITIFIVLIIIYLIKKYLDTKQKIGNHIKAKVIIPADIVALNDLIKLENEKVWQKGNIKEYHSKISEIVRRYTEKRFNFLALEITTDEILTEIKTLINKKQLEHLKIILQRADLAKFAKKKPINDENLESMSLAKDFVNNTKKKKDE